jgi:hypothetical protein
MVDLMTVDQLHERFSWNSDLKGQCIFSHLATFYSLYASIFENGSWIRNSRRHEFVCFAYVTSLRVEWKQMHILCKPKTLPETVSYKLLPLDKMFIVWVVHASLSAAPHNSLIPLSSSSSSRQAQRFASTYSTNIGRPPVAWYSNPTARSFVSLMPPQRE